MYRVPLSPYAKIFYNEWKLDPQTSRYNIVFNQLLKGMVEVESFRAAIKRFISENVLFNSHVNEFEEEIYWVPNSEEVNLVYFPNDLPLQDISLLINKPFNIEKGPLHRFYLIKKNENTYQLVIVLHHLLIDGSSITHFVDELSRYYNNSLYQNPTDLEEQLTKLTHFSLKTSAYVKQIEEDSRFFWQQRLSIVEPVDLRFLKQPVAEEILFQKQLENVSQIDELRFSFDINIVTKLNKVKKRIISPFFYGRAIYALLIHKYTGQKNFCIPYPIAIKDGQDFIYGAQVNTNLLPVDFEHIDNFFELLNQSKEFAKSLKSDQFNHAYLPIFEMREINKELLSLAFSQTTLRNVPFGFKNVIATVTDDALIDLNGDLLFEHEVKEDTVSYIVRYNSSNINKLLLENFVESYKKLFIEILEELIVEDRDIVRSIREYSLLSEEQYEKIAYDWNETNNCYPLNKTIHQLFEEQARRTPVEIAVVYEQTVLSYQELNEKANRLAYYLKAHYEVKKGDSVALLLERSELLPLAILAVLKAGGVYVPVDINLPEQRVEYVLTDAQVKAVIVSQGYGEKNSYLKSARNVLIINQHVIDQLQEAPDMAIAVDSTDLAYILYTSGTTGTPKGVMVEHRTVINLLFQKELSQKFIAGKSGTLWTNINFDVSVYEIFSVLLNGCILHVLSDQVREDPSKFFTYLKQYKINYAYLPPYFLGEYIGNVKLDFVLLGVDKIKFSDVELLLSNNKNISILNGYGPTEATVFCTKYVYNAVDKYLKYLPIGTPISNAKCYVLDQNKKLLPLGAIGELYIGGQILARGYLYNDELTQEKFIENPFQTEEERRAEVNGKLYKTGDLVRWLLNGNLEYVTRNDFQVKIRGYRIELAEIEKALISYEGIKQSVVLVKEDKKDNSASNKYLIGYYVAEEKLNKTHILSYLRSKLPEYMLPSVLVYLKALPLTVNGKLDRKALPECEFLANIHYVAPQNQLERDLCEIWANSLGIVDKVIGVEDHFFGLGGNSILAIKLANRISKAYNINISAVDIFKFDTVKQLAYWLQGHSKDNVIIDKCQVENIKHQLLSFAQTRIWLVEKYEGGTHFYNVPLIYKVSNTVRIDLLERSIESIVKRHSILRTLIKEDEQGRIYQYIIDEEKWQLNAESISVSDYVELDVELEKDVNYIYELSTECPIRVCIYTLSPPTAGKESEVYLSIVIHHIAFDGWSADIFLKELEQYYDFYAGQLEGKNVRLSLPDLTIQYLDFALWQRNYLTGERLEKHIVYWKEKLNGYQVLNLVPDQQRPYKISYIGEDEYFELDKNTTWRLRELAKELKVSLYTILLSAYYLMIRSYCNQDDITIGTPIANRNYSQVENLIGFFSNTLALRMRINGESLIKDFIKCVGVEVTEAHLHQDLPFEKLVEELKVTKDISRHPIFQVMFGVQKFGELHFPLLENYAEGRGLYKVAKFDLSTFIDDSGVRLKGVFNYVTALYSRTTVKGFIKTYIKILRQIATWLNTIEELEKKKINNLVYLTEQEYDLVVRRWGSNKNDQISDKTIVQLFEEQARKTPDDKAIICGNIALTYQQLNDRSNCLAHHLISGYGVKREDRIAVFLDRNEYTILAILGILKSGAAYVPFDPSYPDARIKFQIEDAKTMVILTNASHERRLQELVASLDSSLSSTVQILVIDNEKVYDIPSEEFTYLEEPISSNNLAYVLYTSGTTGQPKGVMIEHKAYVALINGIKNRYFAHRQKISTYSLTNYVFDIFGLEYGLPLLSGGTLEIGNNQFDFLNCSKYDFIQMTPSLCEIKLNCLKNLDNTTLLIGGESLPHRLLARIHERSIKAVNVYGPTETTIWSTSKDYFYHGNSEPPSLSIGKPLENETAYVLDSNLTVLPIGAIGELYIGGIGLARGYFNQPDLTNEKFILNPFQNEEEKKLNKNIRIYKTGDLVRWLASGDIQYIGRNDLQVKIKGHRIELEEIENVLSNYKGIKGCAILVKNRLNVSGGDESNSQLIGYYVADSELDEDEVLQYMVENLPIYAVPERLVHIKEMPVTINGKLDRKVLLTIPVPRQQESKQNLPISSEYEKIFSEIWINLLNRKTVGINDNFFDLGGNSLLLTLMYSKLPDQIKHKLTIINLFQYTTISKICNFLAKKNIT